MGSYYGSLKLIQGSINIAKIPGSIGVNTLWSEIPELYQA